MTLFLAAAQEEEAGWQLEQSNDGEATTLRYLEEGWKDGELEFQCEGTPPTYELLLNASDPPPWGSDFEGTLHGSLSIGGLTRIAEWDTWRGVFSPSTFSTSVWEHELESLVQSEGLLEVEVRMEGREAFQFRQEGSSTLARMLRRFRAACHRHVRKEDRQFELDGIRIDVRVEVSDEEIEDLRALAAELGIDDAESIYVGPYGSSLAAIVTSRAVKEGNLISHASLHAEHRDWLPWIDPESDMKSKGPWRASTKDLHSLNRGIFHDGDRSMEVRLGWGVSYAVADRIIQAIRKGTIREGRKGPSWTWGARAPLPDDFEAGPESAPRISVAEFRGNPPAPPDWVLYEIRFFRSGASGLIYTVRITEDAVEIVSGGQWIS